MERQREQTTSEEPPLTSERALQHEIPWGFLRSYSRTIEEQLLARFRRYFSYSRSRLGLLWLLCEYPDEHQRIHDALHGVLDGSWIAGEIGDLEQAVAAFIHLWGFRFRQGSFEHLEVRQARILDRPTALLLLPQDHEAYGEISPIAPVADALRVKKLPGRADVDAAVYQYVREQGIALDHQPVFEFVDEWTDSTLQVEITRLVSWVDDYFDNRIWSLTLHDLFPERETELLKLADAVQVHPHELTLNHLPRAGSEMSVLPGIGKRTLERVARMLSQLAENWRAMALGLDNHGNSDQPLTEGELRQTLTVKHSWLMNVPSDDELGYVEPERDEPTYEERLLHQHDKGLRKTFRAEKGLDPELAFLMSNSARERKDLVALMDEALDREKKQRWWLRRYVEVRHALAWYGFDRKGRVKGWDEGQVGARPVGHLLMPPEHPIHDLLSPMSPVSAVKKAAESLREPEQEALREAIRTLGQEQRAIAWGQGTGRLQTDELTPAVSRDLYSRCKELVNLLFHDDFAQTPLMILADFDQRVLARFGELLQRSPETLCLAHLPGRGEDVLAWPGVGGGTMEKLVRSLVDAMTHWRARLSGQRQVERRASSDELSAGLSELNELSRLLAAKEEGG